MMTRRILIGLVIGHILLALAYAGAIPYRTGGKLLNQPGTHLDIGAPDERQHANYVQHILDGNGIPVFKPKDPNLYESYQAHQPPLYYVLASTYARVLGVSDVADPSAGLRLRSFSAILGGLAVWGLFCLGYWGFKSERIGLLTAMIGGFMPMMVGLSAAVGNDPMLIAVCTWTLAFLAKALREGWCFGKSVPIALLVAVGIYTKTSALSLFIPVGLALYLGRKEVSESKTIWPHALLVLIGPLVLALPWMLRNNGLYGDPFAIKAFGEAFTGTMQAETLANRAGGWIPYWTAVTEGTVYSFYGVFSYWDIFFDFRLYRILMAATLILGLGWTLSFRGDKETRGSGLVQIVNAAFFATVLALFIRFNMQYFQAQARYLYPAIGPIACGLAVGAAQFGYKNRRLTLLVALGFMVLLNGYVLMILPDEFAARVARETTAAPAP